MYLESDELKKVADTMCTDQEGSQLPFDEVTGEEEKWERISRVGIRT